MECGGMGLHRWRLLLGVLHKAIKGGWYLMRTQERPHWALRVACFVSGVAIFIVIVPAILPLVWIGFLIVAQIINKDLNPNPVLRHALASVWLGILVSFLCSIFGFQWA
jgi:hypothetical protein